MNHTYRLVWNEATQSYVPAAESTRARKKSGGRKRLVVIALAALGAVSSAFAGPSGGEVVAGQASITQDGTTTTISQQSQNASLNWQQFDIAANETVQFVQPSASSIALNRVIGNEASEIYGQLRSNGQVFLINPNGVLFGRTANVDVGGLVASTLNLSDEDFLAGNYRFSGETPAGIVNEGTIAAAEGGSVALLGGQVSNQGTISARLGTVALAAGSAISLDFSGQQLMNVKVDADTFNALVQNHHLIQADGGNVIMTAAARDALLGTVVNNTGVIQARTVEERDGQILLLGGFDGGTVNVAGTLDASAPNGGDGGFIDTSGAYVKVADDARITTLAPQGSAGTWLIDPPDFTIAASGGDISGGTLSANLQNGNVSILSSQGTVNVAGNGDIHVNDAISWSSNSTLTLTAVRHVNLNAAINGGSGTVTLRADSAGACVAGAVNCGTINFAGAGSITAATTNLYYNPTGSNAAADANGIGPSYATPTNYSANVTGTLNAFMLVNDINQLQAVNTNLAGSYALGRNIDARATRGWNGGAGFDPLGDVIIGSNGNLNSFNGRFDGLGRGISGLFINRPSTDGVGLFAFTEPATISNIDLIGGSITGRDNVGALVGVLQEGAVSNATSSVRISGRTNVGGMFGTQRGNVTDAHSTGEVTGSDHVGGLVGVNLTAGTLNSVSSTGAVTGAGNLVGGLVGENRGSITNAYAIGAVTGASRVGGLVGENAGTVGKTYASGAVTGTADTGGLVGINVGTGSVTFSYFDYQTTGQPNVSDARGTARNTAGFSIASAFPTNQWDFQNTWVIILETARPFLRSEYSTTIVNAHQLQLIPMVPADPNRPPPQYVLGADIDLSELSRASGLWNTGRGFVPIGNRGVTQTSLGEFVGTFDGAGHTITGLFMDRSSSTRSSNLAGLFSTNAFGSTIQNVGLIGGSVRGNQMVGGLVGLNNGSVSNVYSTASVDGRDYVGGLVGVNNGGATVSNAYASGAVTGDNTVGGLIGSNSGAVTNVYATGTLSGQNEVGGLLGFHNGGGGSVLSYGYATGPVTGTGDDVGGLVGRNINSSNIVSSFWDTQTSGQATSAGGIGKTTAEMRSASTFSGWNISSSGGSNAVWRIYDGWTGPLLRNFMKTATVALDNASTTYNGSAQTIGINFNASSALDRGLIVTGNTSFRNAGSYSLGNLLYSNQLGYDLSFTGGALNIARANLSLSSNDVVKTYDGTTAANGTATSVGGTSLLGTDRLSGGTFAFADKNAGTGKTVTTSGVTVNDGNGGNNYNVTYVDNTTSTINKANLTLAATSGTKTYDGTTSSNSNVVVSGLVAGDIAGATAAYDSKDVLGTNGSTLRVASYTISGSDGLNASGNYNVSTTTAAGTITPKSLTYTTAAANKVYDGTTAASVTLSGLTGLVGAETLGATGTGIFNSKDVATANTVTVDTATLADGSNGGLASNYSIAAGGTAAANITPKALGYTVTAPDKVYDGTTAASVTLNLADLVGNETLGVTGTGSFNTKDVATANRVTINTASLSNGSNGGLASNYSIAGGGSVAARITPKALNYTATALDKVYDGTTAATVTLSGLTGLVGNETFDATGTGTFNSKDVDTADTVTVDTVALTNGSNGGLASNYSIAGGGIAAANITRKSLTYTMATAADKVYDGTTAATVTLSDLQGLVGTETLGITGTFNSKDVATANTVTVNTDALTDGSNGGLASNYSIAAGTAAANITAKSLTYTTAAANKVYDGTTAASVTLSGLTGLVGNETLAVSGTGAFNSKDVTAANTVTVNSVGLADGTNGGLASNYSIATGGTAAANITARSLTYTATATDKVYDGTTTATVTLGGLSGLVGSETLGVSGTGSFNSKDVATANTVTVDTANLTNGSNGGLATNYSIAAGGTTAANITARSLTYTTTAADKVYDGTTAAAVTLSALTGLVGYETLGVSGAGAFNSKDVTAANTVTVNSVTLTDGANGGLSSNYSIAAGGTTAANITARSLTYTAAAADKVYDGTTAAAVTLSGLTGLVGNETIGASGSGTFNSKDVTTANAVTIDSVNLVNGANGGLASNYTISAGDTVAANIRARALTYTASAADKVYDGTTAAIVSLNNLTGLVGNETLAVSGTGTFNSKDVATANTVTINSVNVADGSNGGLASNYSIAAGGAAAANITARSLTYTTTAADKVYDGTTAAAVTLSGLTGLVGNETVGVSGTGTFNSKDVSTAHTVTVNTANLTNGSNGGLASNYRIEAGGTAAARITPAALTIAASDQTRAINTPNPSFTATYTGFVAGESAATLTKQPTLSTTAETTSAAGSYAIDVSGAIDPNYTFTYVPGTLVVTEIAPTLDYLGALSDVAEIATADRDEEERKNDERFARNHLLLQIKNRGIKLPAGVK